MNIKVVDILGNILIEYMKNDIDASIRIDDFCLYNSTLNERLGLNNIVTGFTVCDIIENHSKFIKYDAKEFSFYANPKKKKEDLVFRYRQGMPIEFISYLKSDESYEKLGISKTKDKGTKVIVKK